MQNRLIQYCTIDRESRTRPIDTRNKYHTIGYRAIARENQYQYHAIPRNFSSEKSADFPVTNSISSHYNNTNTITTSHINNRIFWTTRIQKTIQVSILTRTSRLTQPACLFANWSYIGKVNQGNVVFWPLSSLLHWTGQVRKPVSPDPLGTRKVPHIYLLLEILWQTEKLSEAS